MTFKGKPLANASVVFMPTAGPAAYGNTNEQGVFALSTRGQKGAMIGSGKFLITAVEQVGEMKREEDMSTRDLQNMYKPLIPAKYGRPDQSGLEGTIQADGENHFQLDLK